jgi:hypothetical protein
MNNTNVTFTNCILSSINDITINNSFCGGICGGSNGYQNLTINTVNLTFIDCILSAINDININANYNGGICGGANGIETLNTVTATVTLTFTNCNLNSGNNINITGNKHGGICGGGNCQETRGGSNTTVNLGFTNCNIVATGNIINNSNTSGIICGGDNGFNNGLVNFPVTCSINVILTFMSCHVSALNIMVGGGGICGGNNGYSNRTNVTGPVNLTFTTCVVSSVNDIIINGFTNGGICGGSNGKNSDNVNVTLNFTNCNLDSAGGVAIGTAVNSYNGGICAGDNKMTVTFTNCILFYCTFITFEGGDISSVTYFYLLSGPPLYIIGNTNSNTMTLDQLSGIQSNCLPPPQPIIPIECLCPKPPIPKQGISFGGNLNIPGHEETQAFRISYQLINSLYVHGGRTEFYNAQEVRCKRPPPRNTFG